MSSPRQVAPAHLVVSVPPDYSEAQNELAVSPRSLTDDPSHETPPDYDKLSPIPGTQLESKIPVATNPKPEIENKTEMNVVKIAYSSKALLKISDTFFDPKALTKNNKDEALKNFYKLQTTSTHYYLICFCITEFLTQTQFEDFVSYIKSRNILELNYSREVELKDLHATIPEKKDDAYASQEFKHSDETIPDPIFRSYCNLNDIAYDSLIKAKKAENERKKLIENTEIAIEYAACAERLTLDESYLKLLGDIPKDTNNYNEAEVLLKGALTHNQYTILTAFSMSQFLILYDFFSYKYKRILKNQIKDTIEIAHRCAIKPDQLLFDIIFLNSDRKSTPPDILDFYQDKNNRDQLSPRQSAIIQLFIAERSLIKNIFNRINLTFNIFFQNLFRSFFPRKKSTFFKPSSKAANPAVNPIEYVNRILSDEMSMQQTTEYKEFKERVYLYYLTVLPRELNRDMASNFVVVTDFANHFLKMFMLSDAPTLGDFFDNYMVTFSKLFKTQLQECLTHVSDNSDDETPKKFKVHQTQDTESDSEDEADWAAEAWGAGANHSTSSVSRPLTPTLGRSTG